MLLLLLPLLLFHLLLLPLEPWWQGLLELFKIAR